MTSLSYDRVFCASVMAASPSSMTGILGSWAVTDSHAHMDGLIADLESEDGAKRYGEWLNRGATIVLETSLRPLAVDKFLLQRGTDNISFHAEPVELLAAAFWPSSNGKRAKASTNEVLLHGENRDRIVRIGKALKSIQEEQGASSNAPFDNFIAHCMVGIRDRQALNDLLDLGPDWHSVFELPRRRQPDSVVSRVSGTLAQVGAVEGNPSAIQVITDRVQAGKEHEQRFKEMIATLCGRELHDRRASAHMVVDILRNEFASGQAHQPRSMCSVLTDAVANSTPVDRNHMLMGWITDALSTTGGHERRIGSLAVAKHLWTLTPPTFSAEIEERAEDSSAFNTKKLWSKAEVDHLVCSAASAAFLPPLQAFGPRLQALIQVGRKPFDSTMDISVGRSFALGILGKNSEIPIDSYIETGRFLIEQGCDLSKLKFEKNNGLLHLAAGYSEGPTLQAMLAMVENFGCDPNERNGSGRRPSTCLDRGVREQWESMLRSNTARMAAQAAVDDLVRDMRL